MVSRIVLVAAAVALVCLSVQVQAAPRDSKFFFFSDVEKKETETPLAAPPTCASDAECNVPPATGYCKNFGGLTGFRCVAKRENGKKCSRPAMCVTGKCPSICLRWDDKKCIQKCEA